MQDLEQNIDVSNYCNRLVVLGAKLKVKDGEGNEEELEERLTIESINNGLKYIDDAESIAKYGVIQGQVIYDDVTEAKNLLSKGQKYLLNQRLLVSNKVNALDLSLIGIDIDSFDVGNYYPLIHEILGINDIVRVVEKSISIDNPHTNSITLGDLEKDIKKYNIQAKKEYAEAIKLNQENSLSISKVEKYATDEIYRVDSNVNQLVSDTGKELDNINNKININNSNIETLKTDITSIKNELDAIGKNTYVFDINEKEHSTFKQNLTLASTSVMQSFDIDIDRNILYFSQLKANTMGDIVITKLDIATNNILGSMELKNFGHGTNICVEEDGLDVYIWMECNGIEHSDGRIWGNRVCRFKFEDGVIATNTYGVEYDLLPGHVGLSPSIDKERNHLMIKSKYNGVVYFNVFDYKSVINNNPVKLYQIENPVGVNVISHQGHDIFKNYIYNWEGVKKSDEQDSTAYLTVFNFKGNIKYRKLITIEPDLIYREAEGIKVKQISTDKHNLFIGFAIGNTGDRKANIYKYIDNK